MRYAILLSLFCLLGCSSEEEKAENLRLHKLMQQRKHALTQVERVHKERMDSINNSKHASMIDEIKKLEEAYTNLRASAVTISEMAASMPKEEKDKIHRISKSFMESIKTAEEDFKQKQAEYERAFATIMNAPR